MTFSLSYSSRRLEVLQWYWRTWRQNLWRTHIVVFSSVSVIASYLIYGGFPVGSIGFISVLTIGALPLAVFVAWPMLKFKSQLRTLVVDDTGIATVIGNKSATLFWSDVADVREAGGAIVIQNRNLNAFIVPSRAFRTSQEKQEFRNFIFSKLQSEPPTGSNKFD